MDPVKVFLEVGQKKTFAIAADWPGWCRSGKQEADALQALVDYGPRYAAVLKGTGLGFTAPGETAELVVADRVKGSATTDFGAPDRPLPGDDAPAGPGDVERWAKILKACWRAFDRAVEGAEGKKLSVGPRGGGRDVAKMVEHVLGSDTGYLSSFGGKYKRSEQDDWDVTRAGLRTAVLETLAGRVSGEIPAEGPRGGTRHSPRAFVRNMAWHELDHAWEIEDRIR